MTYVLPDGVMRAGANMNYTFRRAGDSDIGTGAEAGGALWRPVAEELQDL